jgi:hypothetical protein
MKVSIGLNWFSTGFSDRLCEHGNRLSKNDGEFLDQLSHITFSILTQQHAISGELQTIDKCWRAKVELLL